MSSQAASSPVLTIRHTGQVFPLTEAPVAIGRQTDNTIVLADPQASRHHATIYWQAGSFFVQDMGSANGTYVNDRRIT
jgi:pSer/pThr/pTyr-binding forkhead associated (FHA) protein